MTQKVASGLRQKIAGIFGLRLTYSGLTFITSIVLARVLGASGFGLYTYAVVWAYLLSVPATMGLDNFIVRELAVYKTKESWSLMRGLLTWANSAALIASIGIALLGIAVAWTLNSGAYTESFIGFCVAMVLMPALSLRNVKRGAMKGLGNVTKGLLPELLIDPLILISLTVLAYWYSNQQLNVLWVIAFYGVGSVLTLFTISYFLRWTLPPKVSSATPKYDSRLWLRATLPFMLIESMPVINARLDVLMLGAFQSSDAVGLYVPVSRGAQLTTFILMAVGSSLAPAIASRYAENTLIDFQKTITRGVRVITGVAFLFAATLMIFSHWYLLLFGPEFLQGQQALYIFSIGSFLSTAMGLAYVILNMTGHEYQTAIVGWTTVAINIVLNAIFIPLWGVEGAAFATSVGSSSGAFFSILIVKKKLGINATIIS